MPATSRDGYTRSVTRDCRARERGHRLRFDSAPLDTDPGSDRPVRRLIGAPTAPPLPCCAVTDRGFPARAARDAHRLLALGVPAKKCGTRAGPNSAAGRRGRRRSAYEAPRAVADRGTPLGGAESKRRRRPRLPAPPSRVTLLIWNDLSNVLVTFPFLSLWSGAGGGRGGRIDG